MDAIRGMAFSSLLGVRLKVIRQAMSLGSLIRDDERGWDAGIEARREVWLQELSGHRASYPICIELPGHTVASAFS